MRLREATGVISGCQVSSRYRPYGLCVAVAPRPIEFSQRADGLLAAGDAEDAMRVLGRPPNRGRLRKVSCRGAGARLRGGADFDHSRDADSLGRTP